ncbi:hypothetical protein HDU93_009004 [Gonapodya sp. JEL0774]|nr:hypothetical protein HDU93_009004 [Gonapodya sp. JEL0774]
MDHLMRCLLTGILLLTLLAFSVTADPTLLAGAAAKPSPTKTFTLTLATKIVSPDGYPVAMKLANGQLDYAIEVVAGDTVSVTVINYLDVPTSIHWHGMHQRGTPWMDGAAGVTQCLIQPGATFVYTFSVGTQVGTFWWHAHYKSHYVDGLRGPFIIHDPKDPYLHQYSQDVTVTLADHYHNTSEYLLNYYFTPNEGAFEPVPESGLINGVGVYDCSKAPPRSGCTRSSPYVFNFVKGVTYRLRLINEAAMSPFTFSIDGHNFTIIESDGVYTTPTLVDSIRILPSQRYSLLFTANLAIANYIVRAPIDVLMWDPAPVNLNGLNPNVTAVARYLGAPPSPPKQVAAPISTMPLDAYHLGELNGLTSDGLPGDYDQTIYYSFAIQPNGDRNTTRASVSLTDSADLVNIDDSQFLLPPYPDLLNVIAGMNASQLPASSNAVNVINGTWVYVQIRNDDAVEHVFHLHGHTFWVVNSGHLLHSDVVSTYPRRDAIQVPPCIGGTGGGGETGCRKGYVGLLVKFDNPGVWMLHCHIDWHMQAGLSMSFVNSAGLKGAKVPDQVFGKCTPPKRY